MKTISKDEAKSLHLPRYFTGAPCKRGHVAERFINSGRCVECNKVLSNQWKSANGDLKRQMDRDYRRANKESVAATVAAWYQANRDHVIAKAAAHARKNPESTRRRRSEWKKRNPGAVIAHAALRRSRKANAVPRWFSELDELIWLEAGDLVRLRLAATGVTWNADHIIPLACKTACGLHVGTNCQVIPAKLNQRKNNQLSLTEPFGWIKHLHQKF